MRSQHSISSRTFIGIAVLLIGASAAHAQDWYALAGAGQTKADIQNSAISPSFVGTIDNTDTGWKVGVGYQLHPNVAVELNYVDLGEAKAQGNVGAQSLTGTVEAKAVGLTVVGSLPLNPSLSLIGRLGMARWDNDTKATVGASSISDSDSGTDPTYGVGVQFSFSKTLGLRAEWERFTDIDEEGPSDVDLLSASLVFRF